MSQKCMQEKYLLFFIKIKEGTFVYTLSHNKTNYTTNHWAQKLYMSSESTMRDC